MRSAENQSGRAEREANKQPMIVNIKGEGMVRIRGKSVKHPHIIGICFPPFFKILSVLGFKFIYLRNQKGS